MGGKGKEARLTEGLCRPQILQCVGGAGPDPERARDQWFPEFISCRRMTL